jgi:hypothetical protein
MSRQCSSCGAVVRDDNSVFCDRCGSKLPAAMPQAVLTCRTCGNIQSDRLSRFCNRCGSPLDTAVPEVQAPIPIIKRVTCPACGFPNTGEFLVYCRKCGSPLAKTIPSPAPVLQRATCPACGFPNTGEFLVYCRKCGSPLAATGPGAERGPAQEGAAGWRDEIIIGIPPRGAAPAQRGLRTAPVPAQRGPAGIPAAVKEPPWKNRKEAPEKRGHFSRKKLALAAAGVVLILLAIAYFTGSIPGMKDNKTASAPVSGASSPGLFESILNVIPDPMALFNRAVPVVTDTPLAVKTTPAPEKTTNPKKDLTNLPADT